jgi:SAM-dependent methyltransferase
LKTHFNTSPSEYDAMRDGYLGKRRLEVIRGALEGVEQPVRAVVELGSGPGRLAAQLACCFPSIRFTGIDVDSRMVAYASEHHRLANLQFSLADASDKGSLPPCDFMYSVDTLHHIHDLQACLRSASRALSDNGTWLLMEPNIFNAFVFTSQERMRRAGFDEDHLRPWQVEPLMRQEGFRIKARRYAFMFPGEITRLPAILARLERLCESHRLLGGYVIYSLVRT